MNKQTFILNNINKLQYLSAIGSFWLQVVKCDKFTEQTTFLVTSFYPTELKVCLRLEEDEPQIDGEAGHVDGERPVRVKHGLPAVDFPSCIDLRGLVP